MFFFLWVSEQTYSQVIVIAFLNEWVINYNWVIVFFVDKQNIDNVLYEFAVETELIM